MFVSGRLNGFDQSDDGTLDFDVIAYRGNPVATFDGWRSDAEGRGGVVTQVPGGFFNGVKAARFGGHVPYVYELPPVWLLVWDGIDVADNEFLSWIDYQGIAENADNQLQAVADILKKTPDVIGKTVSAIPVALKWAAVGLLAIVALELLGQLPKLPRMNPPRRRRRRS